MSPKQDLRILKTKKALYEGLIKLMQDQKFETIKVSTICEISLVNRSTFYDHFNDKYDLLSSLINNLRDKLEIDLTNTTTNLNSKDYYLNMIKLFLNHIDTNKQIYYSILKNNSEGIVIDITYYTILKDVQKHLHNHSNKTNIPPDIISKFYVSAVISICTEYIKFQDKYTKEDILLYLNKLIPQDIN